MSVQVMVPLSEQAFRRAESLAQLTSREVADVLADTIELALPSLRSLPKLPKPVASLSDKKVLALTELQMEPSQNQHLSLLLGKQQDGQLSSAERAELLALMQIYQEGLLRKAQALEEAVRRGLREPLGS